MTTTSSKEVMAYLKDDSSIRSCPAVGHPVSVATGNVFFDQVDLQVPGPGEGVGLVRSYNSYNANQGVVGGFGRGWTHSYDRRLAFPASNALMLRQDSGVVLYFKDTNGDLTFEPDIPRTEQSWITRNGSGSGATYTRTFRRGGTETYDGVGRLTSMTDASGNLTSLWYGGTSLTIADGVRQIALNYTGSRITSATGPGGVVFATYTYDGDHLQLVEYSEPAPDTTGYKFTYNSAGQVQTVSDLQDRVLESHTYASFGGKALTSEIADGQEEYSFSYNPAQTQVTDALGQITTYEWDDFGGMKQVTRVSGPCSSCGGGANESQEWKYDSKGRVLSNKDGRGKETTHEYTEGPDGQILTEVVTAPDGTATTYSYDSGGRVDTVTTKSVVDPLQNKVTDNGYDPQGHLTSRTETGLVWTESGGSAPYSYVTSYTYTPQGKRETIDGPRTDVTDVTTFEYDDVTYDLTSVTTPLGLQTVNSDFTLTGLPQTVTDPSGVATTYLYDARGRVKSMTVDGDTTTYTYTSTGKIKTVTLPRLNVVTYDYDPYDRLEKIHDGLGNYVQYTYDLMSRRTKEEIKDSNDALQKTVTFTYDTYARIKKVINPDPTQTFTEYGYDAAGNRTSVKDPNGYTTTNEYDDRNRLKKSIQPGPGGTQVITQYEYDSHGNLTKVTDANNNVTQYFYDDMGRLAREESPDSGTTKYSYDAAGNRVGKIDARGVAAGFTYDALNRVTLTDYPSWGDVTYLYDGTCPNGAGRLCEVTEEAATTTYAYSPKGEMTQETRVGYGAVSYAYDANGNLETLTYPNGRTVTYGYDLADRVSSVSTTPSGGGSQAVATSVVHKPMGGVKTFTYGNGLSRIVAYDQQYQVQGTQSGAVQNLTYGRDANGNVTSITDNLAPSNNKSFTYDPLDRLWTASGFTRPLSWTYDGVGNRLTQTYGVQVDTYNYQTGTNRLLSVSGANPLTFTYDAAGNVSDYVTGIGSQHYYYNDANRLYSVNGMVFQYVTNFRGLRVRKNFGEAPECYYDQAGHLISEATAGAVTDYIYLDGEPIAKAAGTDLSFIHSDHLATPRLMTSSVGSVVWQIKMRPFGDGATITGTQTLNLRFPGQYYDSETSLHQNWMREYSPTVARFGQRDPVPLWGRNQIAPYAYVANNPLRYRDPTGEIIWHVDEQSAQSHGVFPPGNTGIARPRVDPDCMEVCDKFNLVFHVSATITQTVAAPSAGGRWWPPGGSQRHEDWHRRIQRDYLVQWAATLRPYERVYNSRQECKAAAEAAIGQLGPWDPVRNNMDWDTWLMRWIHRIH